MASILHTFAPLTRAATLTKREIETDPQSPNYGREVDTINTTVRFSETGADVRKSLGRELSDTLYTILSHEGLPPGERYTLGFEDEHGATVSTTIDILSTNVYLRQAGMSGAVSYARAM